MLAGYTCLKFRPALQGIREAPRKRNALPKKQSKLPKLREIFPASFSQMTQIITFYDNYFLQVYTTPEYLLKRFHSTKIRTCLTAVALISYVLTKISVSNHDSLSINVSVSKLSSDRFSR